MLSRLKAQLSTNKKGDIKRDELKDDKKELDNCSQIENRPVRCIPQAILSKDMGIQTDAVCSAPICNKSLIVLLGRAMVVLVATYLILCTIVIFSEMMQSIVLYANHVDWPRGNLKELSRFDLYSAHNVQTVTTDGITLNGWVVHPPTEYSRLEAAFMMNQSTVFEGQLSSEKLLVLYLHGNSGNRASKHRVPLVKKLSAALDAHVVTFDYRGFGDNEGYPSEIGTRFDALAMFEWIERHVVSGPGQPKIVVYGHSLGSAIAAQLAYDITNNKLISLRIAGLVLDSGFTSAVDVFLSHPAGLMFHWCQDLM